jgi:hypothetical protein
MTSRFRIALIALMGVLGSTVAAHADPQAQMIRALAAKHKTSLVTLSLVVKLAAGGYQDQAEMEAEGVLLDASGLVVTTNSAVDPLAAYADMLDASSGAVSSRVVSVKIITISGAEIPAKVVLRDGDLNLAFVRPLKKPSVALKGVNFQSAATAQLGDPIYLLGRLGKTGGRNLEARAERVVGIMERPRRFYVLDAYNGIYAGNVAFNEQGQPLGLLTLRTPVGKARDNDANLPVIIPARDVWEIAKQVPQAKDVHEASTPARPKPSAKTGAPAKPK